MNAMPLRQFPGRQSAVHACTAPQTAKALIDGHRRALAAVAAAKAAYCAVREPAVAFTYNGRPYWLGSLEAIDKFADSIRPKGPFGEWWNGEIDQQRDRLKAQLQSQLDTFDAEAAARTELDYDAADEAHDAALRALIKHVPTDMAEAAAISQQLLYLMSLDQLSERRLKTFLRALARWGRDCSSK